MSRKLTPEEKAARAKSRNIARLDRKLIEYWKWRQDNLATCRRCTNCMETSSVTE